MGEKYLSDNHTLHLTCDGATSTQIYAAMSTAIKNYQATSGRSLDCRYRVNIIASKEGRNMGFAFVFVSNPEVYYMLLGQNPDGSDRVEYIEDPNWDKPTGQDIVNDAGWATVEMDFDSPIEWRTASDMDWSLEAERSDEALRKQSEVQNQLKCPKICIQLGSLMTLPPYFLTDQQVEEKRCKIIETNKDNPDFDPAMVNVSNECNFRVQPAVVCCLESKFMHNILRTKNVPEWVSERDLKTAFTPFASDSTTLHTRFVKGRKIEECYPFVSISPDERTAFVVFDPSTTNAQFALHMMKKTLVRRKNPDEEMILFFSHSYRSDRDAIALMTQPVKPSNRSKSPKFQTVKPQKKSIRSPHFDVRAPSAPIQQKPPLKTSTNSFSYLAGDE